jgi:hypothetical protein
MRKPKSQGYILEETQNTVVIATGFVKPSRNTGTGPMIQLYILYRHEMPGSAIYTGNDAHVCGDCSLRGMIIDGKLVDRQCYVNLHRSVAAVWNCYRNGGYPYLPKSEYPVVFRNRRTRIGTYGDGAFIQDPEIIPLIVSCSKRWTGYTHQWRNRPDLRPYLMASVDTVWEHGRAKAAGWRTFRVRPLGNEAHMVGEITCPKSDEAGNLTTCFECCLCDGMHGDDPRKDVTIQAHGQRVHQMARLIQIAV